MIGALLRHFLRLNRWVGQTRLRDRIDDEMRLAPNMNARQAFEPCCAIEFGDEVVERELKIRERK
jgi:hypothetical protein